MPASARSFPADVYPGSQTRVDALQGADALAGATASGTLGDEQQMTGQAELGAAEVPIQIASSAC